MEENSTVTEVERDRLEQEAQRVAKTAYELPPKHESWGIESHGDAPGAMGGGVGGFLWFDSKEALLDFVGRLLTFFGPGPSSLDPGRVTREAAVIVDSVRQGSLSMDEGMARLNGVLRRFLHIRWWGQLRELLSGERDFEKEVRAWARPRWSTDDEDHGDSSPITEDELPSFIEALRDYGI